MFHTVLFILYVSSQMKCLLYDFVYILYHRCLYLIHEPRPTFRMVFHFRVFCSLSIHFDIARKWLCRVHQMHYWFDVVEPICHRCLYPFVFHFFVMLGICYLISHAFLFLAHTEGSCLIYVICVCLRIVVTIAYCVVFVFCFPSSCVY